MRVFLLLLPESHWVSARWREAEVLQIYAAVKKQGLGLSWIYLDVLKATSYQGSYSEILSAENLWPTAEFNLLGNDTSSKCTQAVHFNDSQLILIQGNQQSTGKVYCVRYWIIPRGGFCREGITSMWKMWIFTGYFALAKSKVCHFSCNWTLRFFGSFPKQRKGGLKYLCSNYFNKIYFQN